MTLKQAIDKACIIGRFDRDDFPLGEYTALADQAQKIINHLASKIVRYYPVTVSGNAGCTLPDDFLSLIRVKPHLSYDSVDFELIGNELFIDSEGDFDIFYYAVPVNINEQTSENYEFEIPKHTHFAIPYYMVYQLLKVNDVETAQTALTEWNKYVALFKNDSRAVVRKIQNCY